jgi:hypothetical protein
MVWILLFNCMVGFNAPQLDATNLVAQVEKNYPSEAACLKDARRGLKRANTKECYFVCVKGYRKEK